MQFYLPRITKWSGVLQVRAIVTARYSSLCGQSRSHEDVVPLITSLKPSGNSHANKS